ncbi:MAG: symmetrical bis(5'-nucleosyl)-tetraphosphatase [Gammaproteobacteria bacterium]|nr:symmetrical bis(5'-nucleosyl)-tetraphosphatase [Gammaproteobacteria bacterium]MCP5418495.1 symmetrical bis(5'-nucleosyl)-tetraphosphatase [Chromatiaceae bacterium]
MAVYAIGDVQGCYNELQKLLDKIEFNPANDRLWFAGDLVNRGPDSLTTLRFVKGLGKTAITVLGNHDLHLLALSQGNFKHRSKDQTLAPILAAKDRDELLDWLRRCPLMHHDKKLGFALIHAGLPPQWDLNTALKRAGEVEKVLRGDGYNYYCTHLYGNNPGHWSEALQGMDRLRFITNCFTRLRYCTIGGEVALGEKGPPGSQSAGYLPWFAVPGRASLATRIIFGHWSTLGFHQAENTWALDSGCLWGGKLTALKLSSSKPPKAIQVSCPGYQIKQGASFPLVW